jgi:hypothetical protein
VYEANTTKVFNAIRPAAIVNNTAFTSQVIDTQGFAYLEIWAVLGSIDATMAVLKVQEADAKTNATTLTSGTDITGTVVGTDNNDAGSASALPTSSDGNKVWKFEIDLRGRKRYLQLQATAGNGASGTFLTAVAELSRGAQVPTLAADKGAAAVMRV